MRVWMVGLGLVLFAGVARGGWTVTQTSNGTPQDVVVFRPGFFAVATDQELYVSKDGGVTLLPGAMAGSYLQGTDCVVGIRADSELQSVGGCSPDEGKRLFPDGATYNLSAVRLTQDGGVGYAAAREVPVGQEFRSSVLPQQGAAQWGRLPMTQPNAVAQAPLAVLPPQADGGPHALFSVSANSAYFAWYRGATVTNVLAPGITPPTQAYSVALLPGATPAKPLAFFGNGTGLFRGTLGDEAWPFAPVLQDVGSVNALAFDVAQGSNAGTGFGLMLVKQSNDTVKAYSAEPVAPASLVGSVWRVNPEFPSGISQTAKQVSCWGASYCVAILNGPQGNVFIYQNEKPPDLRVLPDQFEVEEGTTKTLLLNPRDGDGDAVRVTATPRSPGGLLTLASGPPPPGDNGLRLTLTAPTGFCASQQTLLDVVASDGLAAHDVTKTVTLRAKHTARPAAPLRADAAVEGGVFFMGGVPGTLTPVPGTSGCAPVRYRWEEPANAPRLARTDTVATLDPVFSREDRCQPDSKVFTYKVYANDGEVESLATNVPVEFLPWGPPAAPFSSAPAPVFSTATLSPQTPLHACAGTPGLPLTTLWSRLDTTPGVTVTAVRGQVIPRPIVGSTPVEGTSVAFESSGCSDTSVTLRAVHHVTVKDHTLVGPESIVDVAVKPRFFPLRDAKPAVTLDVPEERKVRGRVTTPNLNCVASRDVNTVVTLETADAAQVLDTRTLSGAAGDFELKLPLTCGSATYAVRVRVQERLADGGTEMAEVVQPLTRDARDVELGDVRGELVAVCDEGARGTLRQTFPEGACTAVTLDWSHVNGPALAPTVSSDDTAELRTTDTQLESLVGEFVTVSVAATGEGASGATREHQLRIGARPFVSVERRSEAGPGSSSSQVGVVVSLRNETACGVSAVRYEEVPTGADILPGSVRLNGQVVTPTPLEGGGFAVEPVPLAAGATATLTYVIRPAFLGTPTFTGTASLRGVVVSHGDVPPPSTSGCGCSGSGSGVTAFGLGALAWLARRRRGVRARS
ncbi:hypothetical protein OV207_12120 [Corallococcus sp. BB11-1]|uniref:MYXO-CTERM sorting domain-containing protein n=1 Tax=Corallococcus sp. BB11-1 TaxID=2996783 RepID=UPI00226FCEA5|nr:MYXO-CTERM sorting domain-containing protein [Corallococcus sp. BB11-1]MCY1032207.1 hypothetical protein [Corallococcus sp. BB11-1]